METLMSSSRLEYFAETFHEGKTITEDKIIGAYAEFISLLSLLADGEHTVIDKLRHLRILELELDLYRNIPGYSSDHVMEIYLTKTTSLVKMKIELLLFSVEHPECRVSSNIQKKRSGGAPSILWNGSIINLMELIASLDYSGFITNDNGSRQSFDRNKVLNGMVRACEKRPVPLASLEQAVSEIEQILQNSLEREVRSETIGELVMERLRRLDEVSYVRFASVYRQFKDVHSFMDELNKFLEEK